MNMKRIITHRHVDVDAVASVWAAKRYIPGYADAAVVFMPGNWDASDALPDDLIVDMDAGGKGLKGRKDEQNRVHSCLDLILVEYAPADDQEALKYVAEHIDIEDSGGTAVNQLLKKSPSSIRRIVGAFSARNLINDLRSAYGKDADMQICETMGAILTGALLEGQKRLRTERAARDPEFVTMLPSGRVAIVKNNAEVGGVHAMLFEDSQVQAVVIVDGFNMLLRRRDDSRYPMNDERLLAYIDEIGERPRWFAHPSGFMLAHGTKTAPASQKSAADPMRLAEILDMIVA